MNCALEHITEKGSRVNRGTRARSSLDDDNISAAESERAIQLEGGHGERETAKGEGLRAEGLQMGEP